MAEIRQIQVDGVNYDLVISEDEVSATAAAQSAAQALAYKNQAQSSAAQAQTQATNASNQADRAEDAASRAEQIVGGEFLSYGGDQGLDFDQQDQARENIGKATFKSASGSLVNIEHAANVPLRTLTVEINPIQAGSEDPSPSNVRAISGWTRGRVFATGKNLWSMPTVSGTAQEYVVTNAPWIPAGTYTISAVVTSSDTDADISLILPYYVDGTYGPNIFLDRDARASQTFTLTKPVNRYRFYASRNNALSDGDTFTFSQIQLEVGETATAYEAFKTTHEITFSSSAGTVYGGSLDVKTGLLTVTKAKATITSLNGSAPNYYTTVSPQVLTASNRLDIICDKFPTASSIGGAGLFVNSNSAIIFNTSDYASAADLMSAMGGTCDIVYRLATPVTYQCTPTEVTALLGLNNIWADTGDVSLEYLEQGVLTEEYAKYEEERIPQIATKMFSNRNLLDNPWFTVRQRGDGAFTSGYTADRWVTQSTGASISFGDNGATITLGSASYAVLTEPFDLGFAQALAGETVTASVKMADGTVFSGQMVMLASDMDASLYFTYNGKIVRINCYTTSSNFLFRMPIYGDLTIRAVKLELGSVSTLANDAPPDYGEEYRKCRRYFRRLGPWQSGSPLIGRANSDSSAVFIVGDEPMAKMTGITATKTGAVYVRAGNNNNNAVTAVSVSTTVGGGVVLGCTTSGLTAYSSAIIVIAADSYIDISAEP